MHHGQKRGNSGPLISWTKFLAARGTYIGTSPDDVIGELVIINL